MSNNFLQEGLRLVTDAIKEDSAGNSEQAIKLYEAALGNLHKAELVEQGQTKTLIQQKIQEYKTRCNVLKEQLEKKELAQRMAKLGVGTLPSQRINENSSNKSGSSKPSTTQQQSQQPELVFSVPEYVEPEKIIHIQNSTSQSTPFNPIPPPTQPSPIPQYPFPSQSSQSQIPSSNPFPSQSSQSQIPSSNSFPSQSHIPSQTPVQPQFEYVVEPSFQFNLQPPQNNAFSLDSLKPADLMTKSEALQTASNLSVRATEEDKNGKYTVALAIYEKSLDYFLKALKEETDLGIKSSLTTTMRRYLERAEEIKHMVQYADQRGIGSELKLCDFCKKPIGLTEDFKITSEQKLYHLKCFEGVVGLEREEVKKFITGGSVLFKVSIPRRIFTVGDEFTFSAHVENKSNKKINSVRAYILKTETVMHVVTSKQGMERKSKTKTEKYASKEFFGVNNMFPMEQGVADLKAAFYVPSDIQTTELSNGANYAREYDLVIKLHLQGPHEDHRIIFPIRIDKN